MEDQEASRQRQFTLNVDRLKAVPDWVRTFEPFWVRRLDSIRERAEREAVEWFLGRKDSKAEN